MPRMRLEPAEFSTIRKKYVGTITDFTSFSFHAVNVFKIDGEVKNYNKMLNNTGLAA